MINETNNSQLPEYNSAEFKLQRIREGRTLETEGTFRRLYNLTLKLDQTNKEEEQVNIIVCRLEKELKNVSYYKRNLASGEFPALEKIADVATTYVQRYQNKPN